MVLSTYNQWIACLTKDLGIFTSHPIQMLRFSDIAIFSGGIMVNILYVGYLCPLNGFQGIKRLWFLLILISASYKIKALWSSLTRLYWAIPLNLIAYTYITWSYLYLQDKKDIFYLRWSTFSYSKFSFNSRNIYTSE